MPKVGIALAAYKPNPEYFRQQLDSISAQTHSDWICVVSFDSDPAELPESCKKDRRFTAARNPRSVTHKENFLYACSELLRLEPNLDYIAFSDQDDIWLPTKLQTLLDAIRTAKPLSLVHSDMGLFFGNTNNCPSVWAYEGRKTYDSATSHLFIRNLCTGASMLMDACLYKSYGDIPASFTDHDHWFALVAAIQGEVIAYPQILTLYRQHGQNLIGAHAEPSLMGLRKSWTPKSLIQHCINEEQSYAQRLKALPIDEITRKEWASFKHLFSTLFTSIVGRDRMLTRRTALIILGRIFWTKHRS